MKFNEIIRDTLQRISSEEHRFDAGETAVIAKQLEYVFSKTFDVKYLGFKARTLIPVSTEVSTGAETFTYRQWDQVGMADLISNYADDLPNCDAFVKEYTGKCISIGTSYSYSIQDLRAATMAGNQLDAKRALSARRAIESKIEDIAASGNTLTGVTGFLNNANVTLVTPDTGTWSSATAAQILGDLRKMQRTIISATKGLFTPDTLLLSTAAFELLSNTELSLDNGSNSTILQQFMRTSPYIRNVDTWHKLDTANAAGTGPRIVMYPRNPEVVELVISQEPESFAPQAKNLAFMVPMHARVGGCSWRYPVGAAYMDGI